MIVIGNMKSLNMHYDELWFIMRSMDWFVYEKVELGYRFKHSQYDKTKIKQANYRLLMQPNVKVIDELSPSHDLFTWYLIQRQKGEWNQQTFVNKYCSIFINQIIGYQEAKDRLNELYLLDKQGKTVLLVCSCKDEFMCHRSILAGILHGVGCNVQSAFGTDISRYDIYYKLYREIEKEKENN